MAYSILDLSVLVTAVTINLLLSLLTYSRNPQSATHRLFALLCITFIFWSIVNFFAVNAHANPEATWLVRFVMFFSVPLGILFFLLTYTFPRTTMSISRRQLVVVVALTLVTMVDTLSPWLFPEVTPMQNQAPQPRPGVGLVLYIPVVIFGTIYGVFILIRKFTKTRGLQRIQYGYLLLGVTIMFTFIIGLNFISTTFFNTSAFNRFGSLFTLPFTVLTAYAIVRYRLMDIRAAIARSLSFSFLVGSFFAIYSAIFIFAVPPLADWLDVREGVVAAVGALLAVLLARYVQEALRRLTGRFLFQGQVDYRKALVQASKDRKSTINIDDVTKTVLAVMKNVVRKKSSIPKHYFFVSLKHPHSSTRRVVFFIT